MWSRPVRAFPRLMLLILATSIKRLLGQRGFAVNSSVEDLSRTLFLKRFAIIPGQWHRRKSHAEQARSCLGNRSLPPPSIVHTSIPPPDAFPSVLNLSLSAGTP